MRQAAAGTVWLFDLDDTLHDSARAAMPHINASMTEFIVRELGVPEVEAHRLRRGYWVRYGATLLGLMRHHGVKAAHFLDDTHRLPGLEARVRGHRHDLVALARLPGRKFILTNAPLAYAERVLRALGIDGLFDGVIAIEGMHMFGDLRPKPDARMLHRTAVRLGVHPAQCVLVEDTLAHQKAARRVGMATVWMQRWQRAQGGCGPVAPRAHRRPAYVDLRITRLRGLHRVLRR